MKTPTHEEIEWQAFKLWQDQGYPEGKDIQNWLEAERLLTTDPSQADEVGPEAFARRTKAETAAESIVEYQISPAIPEQEAIKAAVPGQKDVASNVPVGAAHAGTDE